MTVKYINITPDEQSRADTLLALTIRAAERYAEHGIGDWVLGEEVHILSLFRLTSAQVKAVLEGTTFARSFASRSEADVHHFVFSDEGDYDTAAAAFDKAFPGIPTGGMTTTLSALF